MGKITRSFAQNTALKLTEVKRQLLQSDIEKFKKKVYYFFKNELPSDFMACYEKYKDAFRDTLRFRYYLDGTSKSRIQQDLEFPRGVLSIENPATDTDLSPILQKELLNLSKRYSELETMTDKIENNIYALSSYSKLKEHFPEAYKYYEQTKANPSLLPSINLDEVRNFLNT